MADGLFPDLKWHHVGFSVSDIEKTIDFYSSVFGLEVEFRKYIEPIDTHFAFLRRDNFRFEIFQKAGSQPIPEHRLLPNTDLGVQGTKHPCFSVGDCQGALELIHKRDDCTFVGVVRRPGDPMVLEEDPVLVEGDSRPPAAGFFFRDPCGLLVEIVATGCFAP